MLESSNPENDVKLYLGKNLNLICLQNGYSRIGHLKIIFLKGLGFRGGLDKKMRRMWFGLGIVVVGLPPLGGPFSIS